ncbi:MAG: RHS repeat domain-containing protein, partial [Longimicrobiales bacterium]
PYGLTYDANGNLISTTPNSGTASWYANNLPRTIAGQASLGPTSSEFFYGPDQRRWKQVTSYAGVTEETIYIAGILEKVTQGSVTAWKHYIAGGSGPAALYIRKSDGSESTHYLARDHLGSLDSISDAAGAVQVRLSYSAFGRRRNGAGWSGEPPGADFNIVAGISRRGFTDHEMLDNLSLVHMNGRVYDPRLGRFISADPYVPDALDTQSFNRYSYVNNNPLSYIDPSGFSPAGGPDGCDPRDIDCGPRPVIPCDFSPHCGSSPWFTPPTYGFIVRSHVRMPVHWPRMPTVPRADFPMGNGTLSQQETVFDGLVSAAADMRQRIRDSQVYGFLSNASEEIALSYGEESVQAKVWDFFGENAVQTVTQAVEGNYGAATGHLIKA